MEKISPLEAAVRTVVTVVVHALLWGGVFGMLVLQVPTFVQIFADFDTQLPVSTQLLITISQLAVRFWFLLIPLMFLGLCVDFFVLFLLYGHQGTGAYRAIWSGAIIIGAIVFMVFVHFSLWMPLNALIENLS